MLETHCELSDIIVEVRTRKATFKPQPVGYLPIEPTSEYSEDGDDNSGRCSTKNGISLGASLKVEISCNT